jgi:hypothetical protein
MNLTTRFTVRAAAIATIAFAALSASLALAVTRDEVPVWPGDMSPSGLRAAIANGADAALLAPYLPQGTAEAVQSFVAETRAMGVARRSSVLYLVGPPNVMANNTAGDRVGESQAEIAVCVYRDTVVVGWNDSQGFLAGKTISSYAYSTNDGVTFTDGGNVPLALPTDQAFGDPGIDTDEQGNWYYNQIYTRTAGNPNPTAEQDIGVHHGRFPGGVLVWDTPVMASIGTSATGNLDKCLLAADRVTGNVYVSYTRFTATPQIEIVRSTALGSSWGAPIVLDATATPTTSKQAARPYCGPGGEVYVVWEKGANSIFCPDGAGNISSFNAQIAFTRSLDFGLTYDPFTIIGNPVTDFLASGPGDLRERGNEFPDIAVDRSNGCFRGNVYVTWHDGASWAGNTSAGAVVVESGAVNNNPGTPDLFAIGNDVTGAITPAGDLDYWQFNATQGQNLMIDVLPQGFVCGVSGTTRQMRVRLFATQSPYPNPTGFPDSILAASFIGSFENRIVWTCPKTGSYLIRLQISGGTTTGTYTMRVRPLVFAPTPARDARDVVLVRSSNQGGSWTAPQLVNDDPAGLENRRPFVAVNNTGQVSVFWHDSRDAGLGTNASLTSVYGTTSRDGGVTWTPNYPVTDELSFFSFNTIGVPNLGDYNQASANGTAVFHPAWSDQRISTGDVRTPGTNTFTAGTGPNAETVGLFYALADFCPPDTMGAPGTTVVRQFRIKNAGNVPDTYNYSILDAAGWLGGVFNGTTPVMAPSSFFDVFVTVNIPGDCNPPSDLITLYALPVGETCYGPQVCGTTVYCDLATPTVVGRFNASASAGGVDLAWSSAAVGEVQAWNVYRSNAPNGNFLRVNADPIAMGGGGEFRFHDGAALAGVTYYRLTAVLASGSEVAMGSTQVVTQLEFSFALAGSNPFQGRTALRYTLPSTEKVRVEVYSVTGQRVRTLVDRSEGPGSYAVPFQMQGGGESALTPGVYMVRISAGKYQKTLRLVGLE